MYWKGRASPLLRSPAPFGPIRSEYAGGHDVDQAVQVYYQAGTSGEICSARKGRKALESCWSTSPRSCLMSSRDWSSSAASARRVSNPG